MRNYGTISPHFWMGKTGKQLKKCPEALIVAMYLITCTNANMLGFYYLPLPLMVHETGLGVEGASKGLKWAINAGFCSYDDDTEIVWVHEMARFQIGESLKAADKNCAGIQNQYNALPNNPFLSAFYAKYKDAFHMKKCRGESIPKVPEQQAPSKPLASQEQEQDQDQDKKHNNAGDAESKSESGADESNTDYPPFVVKQDSRYVSFADLGFKKLPENWKALAMDRYPELNADSLRDLWLSFTDEYGKSTKSGVTKPVNDWIAQWGQWLSVGARSKINSQPKPRKAAGSNVQASHPSRNVNQPWEGEEPDYDALNKNRNKSTETEGF